MDLFKQNKINFDKDTIKQMFACDEFTLDSFKAIINSEDDLNRFKKIVASNRQRILREIQTQLETRALNKETSVLGPDKKINLTAGDGRLSQHEDRPKPKVGYVPQTFETMMEFFGINLQRKILKSQFNKAHNGLEKMFKNKDVSPVEIGNIILKAGEDMKKLISISCVNKSELKN